MGSLVNSSTNHTDRVVCLNVVLTIQGELSNLILVIVLVSSSIHCSGQRLDKIEKIWLVTDIDSQQHVDKMSCQVTVCQNLTHRHGIRIKYFYRSRFKYRSDRPETVN